MFPSNANKPLTFHSDKRKKVDAMSSVIWQMIGTINCQKIDIFVT